MTSDTYSTQNETQYVLFQSLQYLIYSIPNGYCRHVTSGYYLCTFAFTMDVISNADSWINREIDPLRMLLTDTDAVATSSIPATPKASPGSRSCQGIALITFYCGIIARLASRITYISVRWCRQSSTTFNRVISRKPVFVVSDEIRHKVGCTTIEDC